MKIKERDFEIGYGWSIEYRLRTKEIEKFIRIIDINL